MDSYYPYVGWDNHIVGNRNSIGVYIDNIFSWLDESSWLRQVNYLKETLVTNCSAYHPKLEIKLLINDAVHFRHNIILKKLK